MRVLIQIPFALVALLMTYATVADDDYRIHGRAVPSGHESEASFFELVKLPAEPAGAFDVFRAPYWDLAKVSEYIDANGIDFTDLNHHLDGRKTKNEILSSLRQRKGPVFQAFAHLSHVYSIPYKQYSELSFARSGNLSVVTMAGWYKLTFQVDNGTARIIRWEYVRLEGD